MDSLNQEVHVADEARPGNPNNDLVLTKASRELERSPRESSRREIFRTRREITYIFPAMTMLLILLLCMNYQRGHQLERITTRFERLRTDLSIECDARLENVADAARISEHMLTARIQLLERATADLNAEVEEGKTLQETLKTKLKEAKEISKDQIARLEEAESLSKDYKKKFERAKRLLKERDSKVKEVEELVEDLHDKLKDAEELTRAATKRENKCKVNLDNKKRQKAELEESINTIREAQCSELNCPTAMFPAGHSGAPFLGSLNNEPL